METEIKSAIIEGVSSDDLLSYLYIAREVLELTEQQEDDILGCMGLLAGWCRPEERLRSE